jgi:hypothetical protein
LYIKNNIDFSFNNNENQGFNVDNLIKRELEIVDYISKVNNNSKEVEKNCQNFVRFINKFI